MLSRSAHSLFRSTSRSASVSLNTTKNAMFTTGISSTTSPKSNSQTTITSPQHTPAFAFDVDGVLLRGPNPLPGAKEALQKLHQLNIPFVLLTNGGGSLEADKAKQISDILGFEISPEKLQLAHTPFRTLVPQYGKKPVLVIGKTKVHQIAHSYGFENTYDVGDLHHQFPAIFPDWKPVPKEAEVIQGNINFRDALSPRHLPESERISCILVFMDPLHYHRDMQVLVDIARSDGRPGSLLDHQALQKSQDQPGEHQQPVKVFFSGPDLEYVTDFSVPRFGSGIFGLASNYLFEQVSGRPLAQTKYGKPFEMTYRYAETLLQTQATTIGKKINTVYMVGDNPLSDIKGANDAGWKSILVRTGMFSSPLPNDVTNPASFVFDTVGDAVEKILSNEMLSISTSPSGKVLGSEERNCDIEIGVMKSTAKIIM